MKRPKATWEKFDPSDIFAALNAAQVKYLVVGGIAVILHGVNRFTWDVDLCVELTTDNLRRLEKALERIGFSRRVPAPIQGLADPATRQLWTAKRNMKVYSFIEHKGGQRVVDVMVKPLPDFNSVYQRRVTARTWNTTVPLAPLDVLIRMKEEAGREEDVRDVKALKRLGQARLR